METNFNFNSQICTSRKQSEKLLSLGLKKETADMYYRINYINAVALNDVIDLYEDDVIPTWSLHRLMLIVYSCPAKKNLLELAIIQYDNPFEDMIEQIKQLINNGYFNKEFLNNGN